MRRALALLAATLAGPAAAGPLPPADVAAIDAAVAAEMTDKDLPGVAFAVSIPGRGDYVGAVGAANLETRAPRGPQDPFRIASITKTITATVVLQLAEEGALSTADPIARWFPDFPNADRITVDDLLRMRSGIVDSWDDAALARWYADPTGPMTADGMIAAAAARGAEFEAPGQTTRYDNVNYLMLEKIAAAAGGAPFPDLARDRVFAPLGMTASLIPTGVDLPGPLRGYGRNAATGVYEDKTILDPSVPGGAGSGVSTLADLSTYVRALCTGALLSPAAQATRMETAELADAGGARYGQGVATLGPLCGHNGTIMGFSSEAWYLPAEDATIVIDVNRLDVDDQSMSSALLGRIVKALFPDAFR